MATYRITYENPIESKKNNKGIKIYQYCTIVAPNIKTALITYEQNFCWECVKITKIQ